jgi:mono/diheme cytochrome c family protein
VSESIQRTIGAFALAGTLLLAAFHADPSSAQTPAKGQGDAERGRSVFNGTGICFYCHGRDGYRDRKPQLNRETAAFIERLDPPPTDLRKPDGLKLKTDGERFRAIREGHLGTGMFPDTSLTDQEINDTLAYLATFRNATANPR